LREIAGMVAQAPDGPLRWKQYRLTAVADYLSSLAAPATPAARGEGRQPDVRERIADIINDNVSGPSIALGHADAASHRADQLTAADRILAILAPTLPPVEDATEAQPCAGEAIPLVFYDSVDLARRIAGLAEAVERGNGRVSIVGWKQLLTDLAAVLATPPVQPEPRDRGAMGEEA
jgi:hypothetical protein